MEFDRIVISSKSWQKCDRRSILAKTWKKSGK